MAKRKIVEKLPSTRSMLLLIEPIGYNLYGDEIFTFDDEKDLIRRHAEFKRLLHVLAGLGFEDIGDKNRWSPLFQCTCENRDYTVAGRLLEISPSAIALLEGKIKELAKVREEALAKLTWTEQYALGLLKQP